MTGMILALIAVVTLFAVFYLLLTQVASHWVVRRYGGWKLPRRGRWLNIYKVLERLSRRAQVPCPRIYLVEDYSPNAFAITGVGERHCSIVLTDGLLQILNKEELEGVLCLGLAQLKLRSFRTSPLISVFFLPWAYTFRKLPLGVGLLLESTVVGWLRYLVRPERMYCVDEFAAQILQKPCVLASAIRKMSSLSRRVPLSEQNIALDHLFLVSTLKDNLFSKEITHPSPELRIQRLLSASLAC